MAAACKNIVTQGPWPMKRCFVISPIGAEGSEIREHANDVFDYIILPAMKECGIECFRSDHLHEPGRISEQMFNAILKEDLCIALLTGYNPNVFYELAISQAAARPVIILLEKGKVLPFDIQDLRCVYYELKPRPLFERVHVNAIIDHVKSLDATGWKGTNLVAGIAPLGGSTESDEQFRFFAKTRDFGSNEEWLEVLANTENIFDSMGITLESWRKTKGFTDLLLKKARLGCKIRILIMHKDNPVLGHLINDTLLEAKDFATTLHTLGTMEQYFSKVAADNPHIEVRQIRRGCPHFGLTRSDSYALAAQYLYSERLSYCPLWRCTPISPLYGMLANEFESLWQVNAPPAATIRKKKPPSTLQLSRHAKNHKR
jgi:hypothetical protein